MPCEGLCHVEQNEWKEERVPGYKIQFNGPPHAKPGDSTDLEFSATSSDAEIWNGEDYTEYTEMVVQMLGADKYSNHWEEAVEEKFPAARRIDCKDPGCICELADEPTVVEGWTRWRRYEVLVPHVDRYRVDGSNPPKVKVTRSLLKGVIQHRKRIVRGICRPNPNDEVFTPPSEDAPEKD